MAQQPNQAVENNFTKGLVTEYTGLNFPENAATDCDNVEFSIIGNVKRRLGIDTEVNGQLATIDRTSKAVNSYKWNNVGGDGTTQVVAVQVGDTLYFYFSSQTSIGAPLSAQRSSSTITLSSFVASGGTFDATKPCEFTDGNGYLFVFHPSCDPVYVSYAASVFTGAAITVQVRDFVGVIDGFTDNTRPSSAAYSVKHAYNLVNQGWTAGNPWATTSVTSLVPATGSKAFTVAAGITGISGGQSVTVAGFYTTGSGRFQGATLTGTVTSYVGTTLTLNITSASGPFVTSAISMNDWEMQASGGSYIGGFATAVGVYPSNADQWWRFKNASGVFDPSTTVANTSLGLGPAPKGHLILSAFNQDRTSAAPEAGATFPLVKTTARPTNGVWFQGRIWYTGVAASYAADVSGQAAYTWTDNIYFSKVVQTPSDFGRCYQDNDPTSGELFDPLPTDGGVITLQGIGPIYKLFPVANGVLVFGANGIKFITGSQGIGFSATDYTATDISGIKSISSSSFVNVNGLPYFWNEEGIYAVQPKEGGGLTVDSLTVATIASFYDEIPLSSKQKVRGVYHPIDYVIQWIYLDEEATTTTGAYSFNSVLNFNTYNKAFYPYSIDNSSSSINGIVYVASSGGTSNVAPVVKYVSTQGTSLTFADQHDTNYVDWSDVDFDSHFVTGYRLRGQAQRRFQMPYIYIYSVGEVYSAYYVQGIWDYASASSVGRWSVRQFLEHTGTNYGVVHRRPRIRGRGLVLQIKVTAVESKPFDIIGWSAFEAQNTGV